MTKPAPAAARDLLHLVDHGALGSNLAGEPGQPFVSAMPFAVDGNNAPILLVSRLAEHTRNLDCDARASLLLQADLPDEACGVLAQTRMTLIGGARRFEPAAALVARFLRYQPDAERFLALGDFGFFRFEIRRARLIGGFGSMGWLEAASLSAPCALSLEREAELLAAFASHVPAHYTLLGVDSEGVDLRRDGRRERHRFNEVLDPRRVDEAMAGLLSAIG